MSKPPIIPETTLSGIAVDPGTLERVIPESRRPDGSLRKQIKIRPGYTPQEDVSRFRGTRQTQMDANTIPKGHIIGWTPHPQAAATPPSKAGMSKAQKKNQKRAEKRNKDREEVPDHWDDGDEQEDAEKGGVDNGKDTAKNLARKGQPGAIKHDNEHTTDTPAVALDANDKRKGKAANDGGEEELTDKLGKLEVR